MKDKDKTGPVSMVPKSIRTYLILNVALAVVMAIVLAVRAELRTGRHLLVDLFLIAFFSSMLATLTIGPFALVETYLYRRKKGTWYEWRNQTRPRRRDRTMSAEEFRKRRSEAYRARLSTDLKVRANHRSRTQLFEHDDTADAVSRPALLMSVADKFEQSGKRHAAERCYIQITQRFPGSPEAKEAAGRLAVSKGV